MKKYNFAVFILSYKRANNIITYKTLRNQNYTGDIYIVIDNTDPEQEIYKQIYGDKVIVFDKQEVAKKVDTIDNFKKMNAVVYARNKVWDIAKDLELDYFLVLDDDYNVVATRYIKDNLFKQKAIPNLDKLFEITLDYFIESGAKALAYGQNGDFIGGAGSYLWRQKILRKMMNSFFFKTSEPIKFKGSTNEDVNAYVYFGNKGDLFITIRDVAINQAQTQKQEGGLTDIYLEQGTYIKSLYSVIVHPAGVKINRMGDSYKRIHHNVIWEHTVPKILNQKYKK